MYDFLCWRAIKIVLANNRIPRAVRQGIPDRRTSHTESPSAIGAELVARYDYSSYNEWKKWTRHQKVMNERIETFGLRLGWGTTSYDFVTTVHLPAGGRMWWWSLISALCLRAANTANVEKHETHRIIYDVPRPYIKGQQRRTACRQSIRKIDLISMQFYN